MSQVAWNDQIPLYAIGGVGYLGSVAEIKALVRSTTVLSANAQNVDSIILTAMAACKNDLKERIILRAQDAFPDTIAMYKGIWERAQTGLFNAMFPNGFMSFGYISIYGTFVDVGTGYTDTPFVYVNYGVPSAGLFNGGAVNGAFCWDTLHQVMYINRGTRASTDWQYFDSADLVDYITNPLVLHNAFLYGTAYYFFENCITNFLASNMAHNMQPYQDMESRYYEKYEIYVKRALAQLNMDISNGGTITSLDKKFQNRNVWGAV